MSASAASLPVHGFVLAGGKSSRMGADKATLSLGGRALVHIAVQKLSRFCRCVSIAGNRPDLAGFAPVVTEHRTETGPGAGVEAGLQACTEPWALFVPVDVPHVPAELLDRWCRHAIRAGISVSFLGILGRQPVFCLLQRERLPAFTRLLDAGERRLEVLLQDSARADGCTCRMLDERDLYGFPDDTGPDHATLLRWFANLNTPVEFAEAGRHLAALDTAHAQPPLDQGILKAEDP